MRVFLITSLLVLATLRLLAQSISGKAHESYVGHPAYLYTYSDAISNHKILADSCTVKPDGSFHFNFKTDKIITGVISIHRINASLFLEPTAKYQVYFAPLPPTQAKTLNNSNVINLEFETLNKTDINALISDFNTEFDFFFELQVANVFDKGFRNILNAFRQHCDSAFGVYKNPFLNNYIHFCFGNFEQNIGSYRKNQFEKYLLNQKYDLHNPEFALFITSFFDNELSRFDRFSKSQPLSTAITKSNITEFLEQLKNNDFLKENAALRELVALTIFQQEYGKKGRKKTNLLKMMDDLAKLSTLPQSKNLAAHIKAELVQFETGHPAYSFKLRNAENKLVKLESFAGKPLLIMFTAGWSNESLGELSLLKGLYQKYGNQIYFLLVSIDDDPAQFAALQTTVGKDMPLLVNYAADKFITEAMNLSYVPQFALLDKTGHYVKFMAPAPSRGLESLLEQVIK